MKRTTGTLITTLFAALTATAATAASQNTGAAADPQFARDVEENCLKAAEGMFKRPQIAVDAEGSEGYAFAIIYGRSIEAKGRAAAICVVDKKTGVVEVGSEMGPDQVRVRKPKDPSDTGGKNKAGKNSDAADDSGEDGE